MLNPSLLVTLVQSLLLLCTCNSQGATVAFIKFCRPKAHRTVIAHPLTVRQFVPVAQGAAHGAAHGRWRPRHMGPTARPRPRAAGQRGRLGGGGGGVQEGRLHGAAREARHQEGQDRQAARRDGAARGQGGGRAARRSQQAHSKGGALQPAERQADQRPGPAQARLPNL